MRYALKTADNSDLFQQRGSPVFVENPEKPAQFWPVDETVPFDHEIIGWNLVAGTCKAIARQRVPNYRQRLENELRAKRQQEEAETPVDVGGILFRKDTDTRLRLLEAITFSAPGDTILFKDSIGEIRKVSREDLQSIGLKFHLLSESVAATEDALAKELEAAVDSELPAVAVKIEEFKEIKK